MEQKLVQQEPEIGLFISKFRTEVTEMEDRASLIREKLNAIYSRPNPIEVPDKIGPMATDVDVMEQLRRLVRRMQDANSILRTNYDHLCDII